MPDTAGRRGSVTKDRARGTYTVVVDTSDVGAAKRSQVRRRGFRTARETQRALTTILTELDAGTYVTPDLTTTLAQYVSDTWLPALRVKHLRESTLESYQRNLDVHVLPRLGHRRLVLVTTAELDRLYSDLLEVGGARGPLSPRTVRYIHTILLGVFGRAVRKGHLATNPCARADAPSPKACRSRERSTWTAEQLHRFLVSLEGDAFRAPLFLLATTGMRRGEALGLKWADVRLDDAQLDVRRTLGTVNNTLVVNDPKTERGGPPTSSRATVTPNGLPTADLRCRHRRPFLRWSLIAGWGRDGNAASGRRRPGDQSHGHLGRLPGDLGQHAGGGVGGDRDGGVTEHLRHHVEVRTAGQCEGRCAVAQVVQPDRRQVGLLKQAGERPRTCASAASGSELARDRTAHASGPSPTPSGRPRADQSTRASAEAVGCRSSRLQALESKRRGSSADCRGVDEVPSMTARPEGHHG